MIDQVKDNGISALLVLILAVLVIISIQLSTLNENLSLQEPADTPDYSTELDDIYNTLKTINTEVSIISEDAADIKLNTSSLGD